MSESDLPELYDELPEEPAPTLPPELPPLEATAEPPPQPDVVPDAQTIYRDAAHRTARPLDPPPEGVRIPRDAQGRPDLNHPAAGKIIIPTGSQMPDPVEPLRTIPEGALPTPPPAAPPPRPTARPAPRRPVPPAPGPEASPPSDNGMPKGNPIEALMARTLRAYFEQGIPTITTTAPAPAGIRGTVFGAMHKSGSIRIEIEYDHLQAEIFRYKVKCWRLDNKRTPIYEEYFKVHETPLVLGIVTALTHMWRKPRTNNPTRNPQLFGAGDAQGSLDDAARASLYREVGGFPQPGQEAIRPITPEESGGFAQGGGGGAEGFGDATDGEEFWAGGF